MYDFLDMLNRRQINYSRNYKDGEFVGVDFNYPIMGMSKVFIYKQIKVIPCKGDVYEVYYKGYKLNIDPIKDYEVFRLLDAIMITDYGDFYDRKTKSRIKQVDIRPINSINTNKYNFTINGVEIGGVL